MNMDSIKKMMLSGTLGCLISGMAYADSSSPQPAKPYWQDIQVVAVNKEKPRPGNRSHLSIREKPVLFPIKRYMEIFLCRLL